MPKPLAKPIEQIAATPCDQPAPGSVVRIGEHAIAWSDSPARLLHEQLVRSFVSPAPSNVRVLPARTRLAILVGSTTILWLAIGLAAVAIG